MATYNGARTLETCLDAYRRLDPPVGGWKLVVVDNGSTDQSAAIARSFAPLLPLQLCHEPAPGKNAALNSGLREISGDLVVLTDDDVVPLPQWLTSIREAADRNPAHSIFGGKIVLRWETPPERWILDRVPLDVVYGATPAALCEGEIPATSAFGGNMALRASIFACGYRFDPSIGPRGYTTYSMGSETELCLRLARAGFKAWHVENAAAEHIVRDFQVTPRWILRRAKLFGRRTYRFQDRERFRTAWKFLGVPPRLLGRASVQACGAGAAKLGGRQRWFESRWKLNHTLGEVIESRASRQKRENSPAMCGLCCRYSAAGRTEGFYMLMYHRILEVPDPFDFHAVALSVFEAQLKMLSRFCAVLPLEEVADAMEQNRPLPRRCVVLTFDDGYRDLYTLAMPLLERYRLTATLYAAVDCIDRGFIWPDLLRYAFRTTNRNALELETLHDGKAAAFPLGTQSERIRALSEINRRVKLIDERQKNVALAELVEKLLGCSRESVSIPNLMLSWDELRSLARRGLEVGAHTVTHPILTRTSAPDCEHEVRESARILAEGLGQPVRHFAYPNGQLEDYSPQVRDLVKQAGFRTASTAVAGVNRLSQNPWALRRINGAQSSVWELVRQMRSHAYSGG